MARITDIEITKESSFYMLTQRKSINFLTQFEEFSSKGYLEIKEYLEQNRTFNAGSAFVIFHSMDLENLDVEVGYPIATSMPGSNTIKCVEIPSQLVVSAIDQGPYEEQDPTLEELFSWITSHSYEMKGDIYYQYLNTPNRPASEYLTKMTIPIELH